MRPATEPTFGALFSDTFADDTMGFLVDGIYTKRRRTPTAYSYPAGRAARSRLAS